MRLRRGVGDHFFGGGGGARAGATLLFGSEVLTEPKKSIQQATALINDV